MFTDDAAPRPDRLRRPLVLQVHAHADEVLQHAAERLDPPQAADQALRPELRRHTSRSPTAGSGSSNPLKSRIRLLQARSLPRLESAISGKVPGAPAASRARPQCGAYRPFMGLSAKGRFGRIAGLQGSPRETTRSPRQSRHVWTYIDPARLQPILASSGPRVTTADVYPASLCGLIDRRREPRWIFARFHLNDAKALAEAMPVQTPGSGSDGGDPFRHLPPFDCNCWVRPIDSFARDLLSGCANRKTGVIDAVAGKQAPGDPRILVGERDGDNVGVSPLPHPA